MTKSDDAKARLANSKARTHKQYVTNPSKAQAREDIATSRSNRFRFEDEPISKDDSRKRFAEADRILSYGYVKLPMGLLRHPDLNGRDILTAAFLLHYARSDASTEVSEATLGKEMDCGPTTVKDSLRRLAEANLIKIEPRGPYSASNKYHVEGLRDPSISGQEW
jgi:hypothetical protein